MNGARFISLEGGEGVGKSTQVALLVDALETRGVPVVRTREPGGSESAEAIRTLLLTGGEERWTPQAEALLFAAARSDHVRAVIRPALAAGSWVVCDRFVDSSRAYQGAATGLGDAAIMDLHRFGSDNYLPDRTFVLDLPNEQSQARALARDGTHTDRIGGRPPAFHEAVATAFRTIALAEPQRCRLIDALGAPDVVHGRLMASLADWL